MKKILLVLLPTVLLAACNCPECDTCKKCDSCASVPAEAKGVELPSKRSDCDAYFVNLYQTHDIYFESTMKYDGNFSCNYVIGFSYDYYFYVANGSGMGYANDTVNNKIGVFSFSNNTWTKTNEYTGQTNCFGAAQKQLWATTEKGYEYNAKKFTKGESSTLFGSPCTEYYYEEEDIKVSLTHMDNEMFIPNFKVEFKPIDKTSVTSSIEFNTKAYSIDDKTKVPSVISSYVK